MSEASDSEVLLTSHFDSCRGFSRHISRCRLQNFDETDLKVTKGVVTGGGLVSSAIDEVVANAVTIVVGIAKGRLPVVLVIVLHDLSVSVPYKPVVEELVGGDYVSTRRVSSVVVSTIAGVSVSLELHFIVDGRLKEPNAVFILFSKVVVVDVKSYVCNGLHAKLSDASFV